MKRISSSIAVMTTLFVATAGLSACGMNMTRSEASGYAYRQDLYNEGLGYKADRDELWRDQATNEMGLSRSQELNGDEREDVALRVRLKEAERYVEGRREREQYFKHKPLMKSDNERLEFLRLPNYESRSRWLAARGISATHPVHSPEYQKLIEQNDITLGMNRQAVKDSWGEPEAVEVAGNPIYGNERWKYLEELSSPEGFRTESRVIYFESGRVVGWEKH